MTEKINWTLNIQVIGGPKIPASYYDECDLSKKSSASFYYPVKELVERYSTICLSNSLFSLPHVRPIEINPCVLDYQRNHYIQQSEFW